MFLSVILLLENPFGLPENIIAALFRKMCQRKGGNLLMFMIIPLFDNNADGYFTS